ncbi:MAG: hypothetical protein EOL87_11895 [Spartobacteria bacterium]|nr:hypothetical protein [Spartobacteria bacterium]
MKKLTAWLVAFALVLVVSGCSTPPSSKVKNIELGMSQGEVLEQMGEPSTIRAAQIYEDGKVTEIWEYIPAMFTMNPRTFLMIFQDGSLVQWGLESDLTGGGLGR